MPTRERIRRAHQLELFRHGGKRPGAGRKPSGPRRRTPHDERPPLATRYPVLVTVRMREGLPSLRRDAEGRVLFGAFAAASVRPGLRIVHGSIQTDHLHLIVEAQGARALSLGMNGLTTRIARRLNGLWGRQGRVFDDRYRSRVLRTPSEVRNALVYVLHNARKHGTAPTGVDPLSSGPWFDGWREPTERLADPSPFSSPGTWLLQVGWRLRGRIGICDSPARAPTLSKGRGIKLPVKAGASNQSSVNPGSGSSGSSSVRARRSRRSRPGRRRATTFSAVAR